MTGVTAGRLVPDDEARALYLALLRAGGMFRVEDLRPDEQPLLEQLRSAGLVSLVADTLWTVVSPRAAAERLRDDLRTIGLDLFDQARALPAALADLAESYDRSPRPPVGAGTIQQSDTNTRIQARLEQLLMEADREILAMQPGGARPAHALPMMRRQANMITARGIQLRTIYQPGARTDPGTARYAAFATRLGQQVRVLDEPFRRVLVYDRRVAVLGGYTDQRIAAFIEDPVLVELVVHSFERDWARAERVRWGQPEAAGDGQLVALLARGLTQRGIATRLGLSERTVAAQISRLRERYDVRTLFQLGWQIRDGADE
ncbi:LuxR C-terminal-related transcriptional regulator [Kitasatospora sp. NBC_01287]|uniref:LuxR C-terminal-related transcriptional regulator n=1 Tax=Kitasatospora sp. NBC_01287 TaxID=2903573 RepID=UPI002B1D1D73|nr:LuxR C-terminal-related transcriptional regulator [Kitasatospora sp. NBC_01287]